MKVTMDRVGRVVVPKAVRDRLGLGADTEFDVVVEDNDIRLRPLLQATRRIRKEKGWPVLAAAADRVLTDADVQGLRDADRR